MRNPFEFYDNFKLDGVLIQAAPAPAPLPILYSNNDDTVTGFETADDLRGLGGDDRMSGEGGNDRLFGMAGNDDLTGGDGDDTIWGGDDNDTLTGGIGNDRLLGGQGDDRFIAGVGDDRFLGGDGVDTVVYAGSVFDYDITQIRADVFRVVGADGTDLARQVEIAQFDDAVVYMDGRNNIPLTRADTGAVQENETLFIDVLSNDLDIDGDALTIGSVSQGALGGAIAIQPDGQLRYDAGAAFDYLAAGATAVDSFTYTVSDGIGVSRVTTVEVTVTGTNDPVQPGATTLSGAVTEAVQGTAGDNTALHQANGVIAFTDADLANTHTVDFTPQGAGYLGVFAVTPPTSTSATTGGTVGWNFSVSDAALEALGEAEEVAQSYVIEIDDGAGGSMQQTVVVTLTGTNEAPVRSSVILFSNALLYGDDINFDLTPYFIDPNGDAMTYTAVGLPAGLSLDPVTGLVTGALDLSAMNGSTPVQFTAQDSNGASVTTTLTFYLPDPTPDAVADRFAITQGFSVTGNLSSNDPAERGGFFLQPYYSATYALTQGVVTAGPNAGNATVVINPDGTFTYTADPRVWGTDQFAYTITNEFGQTSTAVVTIDIPNRTASAGDGALGLLDATAVNLTRAADGTPTDMDNVEIRIPLSQLTAFASGDPNSILNAIQVGQIYFEGDGNIILNAYDPNNSTEIDGNDLVLHVTPAQLEALGGAGELRFVYGYATQSEIHTEVNLAPEGTAYPPIYLITSGWDLGTVTFTPNITYLDDRANGPTTGDGGIVVGGISGTTVYDGSPGGDGTLGLNIPNGVIPVYEGLNLVTSTFVSFGDVLIDYFTEFGEFFVSGFDIYTITNGADGQDSSVFTLRTIGGGTMPSVIFGANGFSGGDGGDGGDGTDGGAGYIEPLTPLAALTVDGPAGGNGGDGGEGAITLYQIIGSTADDLIVGGNGGDAGRDGQDGADGSKGADAENTYSGGISGGEIAQGGAGGVGGAGGSGGDAIYQIFAGAGNDEIYSGTPGASDTKAYAVYQINAGDGNDTIHGAADTSNAVQTSIGNSYQLYGAAGDDTFVFETEGLRGKPVWFDNSSGITIDGGDGFDTLEIGPSDTDAWVMIGDQYIGYDIIPERMTTVVTGIDHIVLQDGAQMMFSVTAAGINALTADSDAMNILYVEMGTGNRFEMTDRADWARTDDATIRDGVSYDLLFNASMETYLYITDASVVVWYQSA